jgi:hypothetical protein
MERPSILDEEAAPGYHSHAKDEVKTLHGMS